MQRRLRSLVARDELDRVLDAGYRDLDLLQDPGQLLRDLGVRLVWQHASIHHQLAAPGGAVVRFAPANLRHPTRGARQQMMLLRRYPRVIGLERRAEAGQKHHGVLRPGVGESAVRRGPGERDAVPAGAAGARADADVGGLHDDGVVPRVTQPQQGSRAVLVHLLAHDRLEHQGPGRPGPGVVQHLEYGHAVGKRALHVRGSEAVQPIPLAGRLEGGKAPGGPITLHHGVDVTVQNHRGSVARAAHPSHHLRPVRIGLGDQLRLDTPALQRLEDELRARLLLAGRIARGDGHHSGREVENQRFGQRADECLFANRVHVRASGSGLRSTLNSLTICLKKTSYYGLEARFQGRNDIFNRKTQSRRLDARLGPSFDAQKRRSKP